MKKKIDKYKVQEKDWPRNKIDQGTTFFKSKHIFQWEKTTKEQITYEQDWPMNKIRNKIDKGTKSSINNVRNKTDQGTKSSIHNIWNKIYEGTRLTEEQNLQWTILGTKFTKEQDWPRNKIFNTQY